MSPAAGPTTTPGVGGEVAEETGGVLEHLLELAVGLLEERPHLHGVLCGGGWRAARGCRRRSGSPSRWGSGRRWCAAGGGSPPARGWPCRCAPWPTTPPRRPTARRAPTPPAGRCRCTPPRRPGGWRPCVRRACAFLALDATECQPSGAGLGRRPWQPGRMRFVVVGAGAVGGVVGGRLAQHGHDVVLVARGDHGQAIAADGLLIRSPDDEVRVPVPVVSHPSELTLTDDDVVLLAVKGQDTRGGARGAGRPVRPTWRSRASRTASTTSARSCAARRTPTPCR